MDMTDPTRPQFENVLRQLMKAIPRTVTKEGIRWHNRHYLARKIMVRDDPQVLIRVLERVEDQIWVYTQDDRFLCVAHCPDLMTVAEAKRFNHIMVSARDERLAAARALVDPAIQRLSDERPTTKPAATVQPDSEAHHRKQGSPARMKALRRKASSIAFKKEPVSRAG